MKWKCGVCGFRFDMDDLVDWTQVFAESYEIYGQDSACPECGQEFWISADDIERTLADAAKTLCQPKERTCAKKEAK